MHVLSSALALAHLMVTTPPPEKKRGWLCLVKNTKEALKISQFINIFQKTAGSTADAAHTQIITWVDYQKAYFPMHTQPKIIVIPEMLSTLPVDNPEQLRATEKIIQVRSEEHTSELQSQS